MAGKKVSFRCRVAPTPTRRRTKRHPRRESNPVPGVVNFRPLFERVFPILAHLAAAAAAAAAAAGEKRVSAGSRRILVSIL